MTGQVRPLSGKTLLAGAVLCCAWILPLQENLSFAQTADAARAVRIRDQVRPTGNHPDDKNELNVLRGDLTKAIEAVVSRIDALEKDMIDIKSRMSVLEAHKSAGDTKKADAATPKPPH